MAAGKVEKEKKKLEICPEMSLGRKIRKCALQHSDLPLDEGRFYYEFEFFFLKKKRKKNCKIETNVFYKEIIDYFCVRPSSSLC